MIEKFDQETCWYKQEQAVDHLLRAYDSYLSIMSDTEHIQTFRKMIDSIPPGQKIIDLGCGSAQISLFCGNHTYVGADFKLMINGCAKIKHPEHQYIEFDAETTDWNFISEFDVVLMNAFIDVMQYPLDILNKVLQKSKKYVFIHRQELTKEGPTKVIKAASYGGETYHSIINAEDFVHQYVSHGFKAEKLLPCGFSNWEDNGSSILLKK